MSNTTYVLVDGENIDATLGLSVLGRRPESNERPRWDRVLEYCEERWPDNTVRGLFFLNASWGQLPMNFIQALISMSWRPIPLAATEENQKVVDLGIQRTLDAVLAQGSGDVILVSHDVDFIAQVTRLLEGQRRVAVICFREFLSSQLAELADSGLEIIDIEMDVEAFTTPLPRVRIIPVDEFDPYQFI